MSFDFATQQVCPHVVVRESVAIDPITHLTAPFARPPVNQAVTLEIDGVAVPPGGLFSTATLPFTKAEPYRIKSNVNDLLYIRIGFDAPQFIQIMSGSVISAADLARDLQRKLPNLNVTVQSNRVVLSAKAAGAGTAFSFPDPRWTDKTSSLPTTARILGAYSQLGIVPGRSATGKKIYPGWSLIPDPTDPLGTGRLVRFESTFLNHDPVIQLSYITDASNCRRCFGTRIEFDYSVLDGTYEIVQDTDLLAQEFDKFVYTKAGSHWKWPWLGSGLLDRIGGKGNAAQATANAMINVDISVAFKTYQSIKQQQDSRFPFQQVSDAEYPATLIGIVVQTLPSDPTVAIATTTLSSRSRVPVELKRVVGNPNPFVLGSGSPFGLRG